MSQLTYTDRATLRRQGIEVLIEYSDGRVKCRRGNVDYIYTADDLRALASRRPFAQRLWRWISGRAAA